MNQDRVWAFSPSLFYVISTIGLALVPLLVMRPVTDGFQFAGQRGLVGALFCTVCVFGVAAVFYPVKCKGMFQHTLNPPAGADGIPNRLRIEGHHPSCQNFSENRITIRGRVLCAACSGLMLGATIALIGAVAYFFDGLNMAWGNIWLVVLGEICMLSGLVQIKAAGFVKAILNAVFVVGSFATLATTDSIGKSLFIDLYVLGLILFLLWFRISLSEWNNRRTCRNCLSCFP